MKKSLLTKISAISLGVIACASMAFAGIRNISSKEAKAETGTSTLDFTTTTQCTTASTTELTYSDSTVTFSIAKGSASTATNNYYPGTSGKTYTSTRVYKSSIATISSNYYLTSIVVTAGSTTYATALGNSTYTNATASVSSSTVTITPSANVKSVTITFGATIGFTKVVTDWNSEASTTPELSPSVTSLRVENGGTNTFSVSYANLSSDLTISSDSIASTTFDPVSSGTGSVDVTVNGLSIGTTDLTISSTGATSKTVSVTVYDAVSYVQLDVTSRLKDGMKVIIVASADDYAAGVAGTNNIPASAISKSSTTPVTTKIDETVVTPFVINKVTAEGYENYWTIKDSITNKYLYASSSSSNYLSEGATAADANYYWDIAISSSVATLTAKGTYTRNIIKFNQSSKVFSCYASGQADVALYMEGSELPSDVNVTSISNITVSSSVEQYESVTLTASYLPIDATEMISIGNTSSETSTGSVEYGAVSMSNGTLSVTLTGVTVGEVYFTLSSSSVTSNDAIEVTNTGRIYNSGLLTSSSVSTTACGSVTTNNVVWQTTELTCSGTVSTSSDTTKGVGIGTKTSPVSAFELTSDLFIGSDYNGVKSECIETIIINASTANNGSATLSVYVDNTQVGSTVTLTTLATDYSFDASAAAGHIRIAVANSGSTAFYLGSIIVKGTYLSTSNELYSIARELEAIDSCSITAADWATFKAKENESLSGTYAEIFDAYSSELSAINLYDHSSQDSSSAKKTSYSALAKYQFIESYVTSADAANGVKTLLNNTQLAISVSIIVLISLSGVACYFMLRKKKLAK